jgi:hypothetical protein
MVSKTSNSIFSVFHRNEWKNCNFDSINCNAFKKSYDLLANIIKVVIKINNFLPFLGHNMIS